MRHSCPRAAVLDEWRVQHMDAVPTKCGNILKRKPVGQLETEVADRGFPAGANAGVVQVPMRPVVIDEGSIHSLPGEQRRAEEIVAERKGIDGLAEADRPGLGWMPDPQRGVPIEDPHNTSSQVFERPDLAKTVLRQGRPQRHAGVVKQVDKEVVREIHRVNDVLQAEEVRLPPHVVLFAQAQPVATTKGVKKQVEVGFANRIVEVHIRVPQHPPAQVVVALGEADVGYLTRVLRLAGDMVARPGSQAVKDQLVIDRPDFTKIMGIEVKRLQQRPIERTSGEPTTARYRDGVVATATTKAVTDIIDRFVLRPQFDKVLEAIEVVLPDPQRAGQLYAGPVAGRSDVVVLCKRIVTKNRKVVHIAVDRHVLEAADQPLPLLPPSWRCHYSQP